MAILDEVRTEVVACLRGVAEEATLDRVVVGIFFIGVKLSTGTEASVLRRSRSCQKPSAVPVLPAAFVIPGK